MDNLHEVTAKGKSVNGDSTGRASWLRLWHDMPTDPKFRVIARKSVRPLSEVMAVFVMMLTTASAAAERGELEGWSDEDVAAALDLDTEHVTAIRSAMQGKMLDGERLSGWDRRQPKREDNSTERVRAHRERQRTPETRGETQCNACETPPKRDETLEKRREDKIREEKKDIQPASPVVVAARDPAGCPADDFSDCKLAFNGSTEAMLVEVERAMGSHADRRAAESWLATTLRINGPEPVAQAFAMLATKRAENSPIGRVLPWWSKTAASLKAKPPPVTAKRSDDPFAIKVSRDTIRHAKPAPGSEYVHEVAHA